MIGEDPAQLATQEVCLHAAIIPRWAHILTNGLNREVKDNLIQQYPPPSACKNLKAPLLNPEVVSTMSPFALRKDKQLELIQPQ